MTSSGVAERPSRPVATLCGVQFVDVLGVTSAITALPAMLSGLSAPASATPVVATVYAMFFGGLLVLGARLGDRYGHRRILLAGVVLFTAVSLVGATAQDIVQLVVARGLQGAAAAISVPSALRLLLVVAPEADARRRALAAWSATGAAAGATGLLAGGLLTEVLGWRAVFWINVPVGVLLILAVVASVPARAPGDRPRTLDLPGATLLTGAVMALILGGSLLEHPGARIPGVLAVLSGLLLAAVFLVHQRRTRDPLVPRDAFGSANLRTGTAVSFVNTATTSSAGVLATLLLQQRFGVSAMGAGLALLPFSLSVIGGSALTGPLSARLSPRRMAATGLAGIGAGNLVLAATYGSIAGLVAGVAVAGTGLGVASVAATAIGTDVPESLGGVAGGVLNTGAQVGTAIGVAALLVLSVPAGTAVSWAVAAAVAFMTAAAVASSSRSRL